MLTPSVQQALDDLRRAFPCCHVVVLAEDGAGGAYVVVEGVSLSKKFVPQTTWVGAHLPPSLPYADVYPVFIDGAVRRADGRNFEAPVTPVTFQGRPAWQVSRRTNRMPQTGQPAPVKFMKVLQFLESL